MSNVKRLLKVEYNKMQKNQRFCSFIQKSKTTYSNERTSCERKTIEKESNKRSMKELMEILFSPYQNEDQNAYL